MVLEAIKAAMENAEARGVTRYRLAKDTGISQAVLSRFANGHTEMNLANLEALAKALGLEIVVRKAARKGR